MIAPVAKRRQLLNPAEVVQAAVRQMAAERVAREEGAEFAVVEALYPKTGGASPGTPPFFC